MTGITIRTVSSLSEVEKSAWDAIANPAGEAFDPFLSWDLLQALEESGCATTQTGWQNVHFLAETDDGGLAGALPAYAKAHSYGEYVFDHAWADAFERAGGRYYPKLLSAIPFTPATGRRLLARDPEVRTGLARAAMQITEQNGLPVWSINFPANADLETGRELGMLHRIDRQYIWENREYASYESFLGDLSSRKRKALKKERAAASEGIEIVGLTGDDLRPEHWDVFFKCYQETGSRKWGRPYLNRDFFDLIHQRMADRILLVMAREDGRYFAAALNFIGSEALFGRYWGSLYEKPFLHFELCYHRAIDFAIANGLDRVEAGAQGEHKLARGYRPRAVHSLHYFPDESFRNAVADYLDYERCAVLADIEAQQAELPFKKLD
ncbi:GNAT family N-acetyltransferase [Hyphobacterium sp. HN65]|uniref:GNAT family N-acetyltransferase n=1 Tax=Hyphobacterium lacteum TaxID=3116575 RepID=A0ABU7LML4_9PROT|nr:GNAT family N-acetyltransferase [Hyphobacterium sp. HN65]MEE2525139.1 GNAT family N-acetyltransferase [Hyphobacterium sp. HN65]